MKRLFAITLLFATPNLLSMNPESEEQKNNWQVTFIPTNGRKIPQEIISFNAAGEQRLPVDPFVVSEILRNSYLLKKLFEKYGKGRYPASNASMTVALLFAKGQGGYSIIDIQGKTWGGELCGLHSIGRGKVGSKEYAALKRKFKQYNVEPHLMSVAKETVREAHALYLSLFPEEKPTCVQFKPPLTHEKEASVRKLMLHNLAYQTERDGSMTFFVTKKVARQ
jgi:hypothetical protein